MYLWNFKNYINNKGSDKSRVRKPLTRHIPNYFSVILLLSHLMKHYFMKQQVGKCSFKVLKKMKIYMVMNILLQCQK